MKNIDLKEDVCQIREQYCHLVEKVDLMNSDLDKVHREYRKTKIHRYNILTYWLFVTIEIGTVILGLRFMYQEGYPFWVGLSLIYMLALVGWTSAKKLSHYRQYFRMTDFNLKVYWEDEDKKLRRSYTAKSAMRTTLILSPVLIHGGFVASYLNSIGEINTITGNWKVELLVLMVLLMIAAFVFGKLYMRSMLNIFSEE